MESPPGHRPQASTADVLPQPQASTDGRRRQRYVRGRLTRLGRAPGARRNASLRALASLRRALVPRSRHAGASPDRSRGLPSPIPWLRRSLATRRRPVGLPVVYQHLPESCHFLPSVSRPQGLPQTRRTSDPCTGSTGSPHKHELMHSNSASLKVTESKEGHATLTRTTKTASRQQVTTTTRQQRTSRERRHARRQQAGLAALCDVADRAADDVHEALRAAAPLDESPPHLPSLPLRAPPPHLPSIPLSTTTGPRTRP